MSKKVRITEWELRMMKQTSRLRTRRMKLDVLGRRAVKRETKRSEASKRSKLGCRWSKTGEEETAPRYWRLRSESDLLLDLSRFI